MWPALDCVVVHQRARSSEDKARRAEDLLAAAEALAVESGGVRHVTVAAVARRAGIDPSGMRRYFTGREELLLELAERGWARWRDAVRAAVTDSTDLSPAAIAVVVADTIASLPTFCDLLTHVPLSLEGDVALERARRYKASAFAAHDDIVGALARAGTMSREALAELLAAALAFASYFWQVANPTPTLAALYDQVPEWGHVATEFHPRLRRLLAATALGLTTAE